MGGDPLYRFGMHGVTMNPGSFQQIDEGLYPTPRLIVGPALPYPRIDGIDMMPLVEESVYR